MFMIFGRKGEAGFDISGSPRHGKVWFGLVNDVHYLSDGTSEQNK